VSGLTEAFVISAERRKQLLARNPKAGAIIRPFLQGRDIRRYHIAAHDEYLVYTHHGIDMTPYPAVIEHLRPYQDRLRKRATRQPWYELQQPQYAYVTLLEQPKIIFPDMATHCRFTLDTGGHFGANTMYFLPVADKRLLALLNSRVGLFYFKQTCAALEGSGESYLRFFEQYVREFPVPSAELAAKRSNRLVDLVDAMLRLHEKLPAANTAHATTVIQRQIDATDRRIDALVYELYGLSDKEIALVEEATP
jgi:hypothetical protein